MNEAELVLLEKIYEDVLINNPPHGVIKSEEIKAWDRRWLGNIYEWAGMNKNYEPMNKWVERVLEVN